VPHRPEKSRCASAPELRKPPHNRYAARILQPQCVIPTVAQRSGGIRFFFSHPKAGCPILRALWRRVGPHESPRYPPLSYPPLSYPPLSYPAPPLRPFRQLPRIPAAAQCLHQLHAR
jgi:hypothetical protein